MSKRTKLFSILKTARLRRGFSQERLANHSGVSARSIQEIESGRAKPSVSTLQALADTLKMPLAELIGPSEHEPSSPSLALSKTVVTDPSAADVVAIGAQLLSVSPQRRAIALAWLFDDPSLLPEDLSNPVDLSLLSAGKKP